ncbi:ABC transporter substrate-binding protein [Lutibaculum baratangense]|uniref:Putative binding-protein-dependent transport protein n=1 Tax=Lutibaculum baratangense AMV1 TaxID=631454 RepID=V4R4T1_9HYPH|nr:ABC transporter substrate-binding protein [Lutibaculum baratangense]ESR26942.1 putative binding-protein-dependent transport protein [Lutibaculum baratangense AMV1]
MTRLTARGLIQAGLISAGLAAGAATGAHAQAEDVTIGAIGPLTGPAANSGEAHRQGLELAVKEWNEGQGDYATENRFQVNFVMEDSNSKPEVGISAAQRLITRNSADLIIGDTLHSHVTLALMEMAPQYNVPILSSEPVSSVIADKVLSDPERFKLYWKGNWNSDGYGIAVHDFYAWAFENGVVPEGDKKIAFVVEDTDYGIANAEKIGELFEGDGWTVVATETVPTATTDFYPQLSKLRDLDPDVLVSVFTVVPSGVSFVRQLGEQALEASHLAIYYPTKPEFMEQAADIAEGMYWASLQFSPEITPAHKEFSDRMEAAFGVPANYSHAHAYCTMVIALRAIDEAGGTDPEAVAEKLGATDYECLLGRFQFGDDHAIQSGPDFIPVPVAQIQEGQNQLIWPENVATSEPQ